MTEFVAIDGEALEVSRGDDRYALLCDSTGRQVSDPAGLSTTRCLEFLLGLAQKGRTLVCFGLGYDANNWCRDMKPGYLRELWAEQIVYWGEYRIEWLPGRWFSIKHVDGRFVKVCEVFGFFQTSFVKTLKDWGMEVPGELAQMKTDRGTFKWRDLGRVTAYCHSECELLVTLMDKLQDACREASITPKSWIGAGAIAAALLQSQGMAVHHHHDLDIVSDPAVAETWILGAYFAGRIELLHQGVHQNVKGYDIRSAYPAAATLLPSLDGATMVHRKRYAPDAQHAVWRVSWSELPGFIMPFPTRQKTSISYPRSGTGIYHAAEVSAARACFGDAIVVHEGYVLKPRKNAPRAFDWVPELYAQRAAWQRAGNPAQKPLKLGLNSLYGKLAQGYGYQGREPAWQCYMWAGEITSRTRAKMLLAAFAARKPIMIATDGLYCATAPRKAVPEGKALGAWEHDHIDTLFAAQAGVYEALKHEPDNEDADEHGFITVMKSRGFFAKEVDYGQLRDAWERDGPNGEYTYQSKRFNGLGTTLHRNRLDLWRTWTTEPRTLHLMPQRKHPLPDGSLQPIDGPVDSEPYTPKISLTDARILENIQGGEQPLRDDV